ncbi:lytic transglycosylase domain-containing protein [Aestuariivirga litoralis]|uniref:lytic transglycosylase domain-containing protein n=1 Tax=Aestuariivirga litoralis TaxID=2650924 RepID=UPI0018C45C67|nr:lytic transglycosylase domain-containing protein [Aestuariivirga litoralis]MBG1231863.1 lytic transglycosylase domain-containing protein [Aestuariivirga litoralis]
MARWWKISFLALALSLFATASSNSAPNRSDLATQICTSAEAEAKANGIDPSFFVRLLWRESLFDPNVVSDKGAQGIAQFMPGTAAQRGLKNPFDPVEAVKASAAYLSDLKKQFGNIGLAAAAYNAGEKRITDWLADKGGLPYETRDYVAFITGHEATDWRKPDATFVIPAVGTDADFNKNCVALALRKQDLAGTPIASAPRQPWGALLAVNFSEARAIGQFRRLKLRFPAELANRDPMVLRKRNLSRGTRRMVYVMLGEDSRAAAEKRCQMLNGAGAPCIVRRN